MRGNRWDENRVKIVSCPGKGVILHGDITDRRRKDCNAGI